MNLADPNNLPKKPRKPRKLVGGEPFDAEPGATEASEQWKKAQLARLVLRNESEGLSWHNAFPTLDSVQDYPRDSSGNYTYNTYEMLWDDEAGAYYTKTFYRFKVMYRYYRGQRTKSYLFWPQVCIPGYSLQRQNFANERVDISTETGTAVYVRLGTLSNTKDYYGREQEVWGLWKSTGTMKPRRTTNG